MSMPYSENQDATFREFILYPFSQDESFQEGLKDLATGDELSEELVGRAKAYYFSRISGKNVDWTQFLQWQTEHAPSSPNQAPSQAQAQTSQSQTLSNNQLSFQQIAELIRSGQTHLLPHTEQISDDINPEQPSISKQPVRKKPWE